MLPSSIRGVSVFCAPSSLGVLSRASNSSAALATQNGQITVVKKTSPETKQAWDKRVQLRRSIIQRDQLIPSKVYFAPEWDLDKKANKDDGHPNPLKGYGMTPEKWEYYNKVVWPPNYIVPETGLAKPREVYHCRESIHFSSKRMWQACQLVLKMNVDEAIVQLDLQQTKGCSILSEVLTETKKRSTDEFHIEYPSDMHVAEAFPVQSHMIKGARRQAHENWCTIRYRYIHLFVRLEEGTGPGFKTRDRPSSGWDKMDEYYGYLRNRSVKYGL